MKNQTPSPSRRQILTGTGIAALAAILLTPREAKANRAIVDATRTQIKFLRKAKRRVVRRIRTAKGRRIVARNYDRSIRDAKRRLRQAIRDCE